MWRSGWVDPILPVRDRAALRRELAHKRSFPRCPSSETPKACCRLGDLVNGVCELRVDAFDCLSASEIYGVSGPDFFVRGVEVNQYRLVGFDAERTWSRMRSAYSGLLPLASNDKPAPTRSNISKKLFSSCGQFYCELGFRPEPEFSRGCRGFRPGSRAFAFQWIARSNETNRREYNRTT